MPGGTLGRRLCPFLLPVSAGRHPWATFMPLFVACECRATPLGDVLAPVRCLRVPPCVLGRHSRPCSSPQSGALRPWATFSPLFVACECRATPLGDVLAHICRLRVPPCAFGRRLCPFLSPVSAGWHPWTTFMPLSVACECRATPLGDIYAPFRCLRVEPYSLGQRSRPCSLLKSAAPASLGDILPLFVA